MQVRKLCEKREAEPSKFDIVACLDVEKLSKYMTWELHCETTVKLCSEGCSKLTLVSYLHEEIEDVLPAVGCSVHDRRGALLVAGLGHGGVLPQQCGEPLLVALLGSSQHRRYQRVHRSSVRGGPSIT